MNAGFTTVQSLGAPIDGPVRDAIARGEATGPRILTSLIQITGTSGDPGAIRALVRRVKADGVYLSDATLTLMAERGTWFDPNLLVWHNYVEKREAFGMTDEALVDIRDAIRRTAAVIRRARALHVRIVFGTDAVAGAHGRNAEDLVYRVQEAGEKAGDVLMSATSLAAESLGLGSRIGTIASGYEADLVATPATRWTTAARPGASYS